VYRKKPTDRTKKRKKKNRENWKQTFEYKETNNRVKWYGHVLKIDEDGIPKVFNMKNAQVEE
jgi:hypothetical protein